jgi:hypothetical protein
MNRRTLFKGFAATAAGLLVPEPVRAYSFVGGWAMSATPQTGCVVFYDPLREMIGIRTFGNDVKVLGLCEAIEPGARSVTLKSEFHFVLDPTEACGGIWRADYDRALDGAWAGRSGPWSEDFGT